LKRTIFAAALAGVALISFEARAQITPKSVQFGVAAGVAIPTSDLSNTTNTGFNVTGILGFQPTMIPLGVRVDAAYNQFGAKGGGANAHFTSVSGNLVYKIPSTGVTPYLIGGAGWYNTAVSATGFGTSSENDFGWNVGGGITMPLSGFETFLEARYNQVQVTGGSLKFIPVTFGVMF
jgi:Outer membrane protein beta-barrel domain